MNVEKISSLIQVFAVVVGVVISILSFNDTRAKEIEARIAEIESKKVEDINRRVELLSPFLELRQKRYVEVSQVAAIMADPEIYTTAELEVAYKRFRALYITELSMVETPKVEALMKKLAIHVDPKLLQFSESQSAAYNLAQALKESYTLQINNLTRP